MYVLSRLLNGCAAVWLLNVLLMPLTSGGTPSVHTGVDSWGTQSPSPLISGSEPCTGDHVIEICNEAELRRAVERGGWIRFCCSGTIPLTGTIWISNSVVLDATGRDVIIDGQGPVQLLNVEPSGSLSVTNVTFVNGYHEGLPGIDATAGSPAIAGKPGRGGAILNVGGRVSLTSCVLSNNRVVGGKGPIDPTLGPDAIPGNGEGGAIFNDGGVVVIQDSRILNNTAHDGFPAADAASEPFLYASARGLGGAIYNRGGGTLTVQGTEFRANSTDADWGRGGSVGGGALYIEDGSVNIVGGSFVDNWVEALTEITDPDAALRPRPGLGGAIYLQAGLLAMEKVLLTNNIARGSQGFRQARPGESKGGALFAQGDCRIIDSTFWGNQALAGGGSSVNPDGHGGAIFNVSNLVVVGCTFVSNVAAGNTGGSWGSPGASWPPGHAYGGAIYNGGSSAITNCTLTENVARGGNREGFLSSNTVAGNAFGGGLYHAGDHLWMVNVTIASNRVVSPSRSGEPAGSIVGANLFIAEGMARLRNSILAGGGTNRNVEGTVIDEGFNMSSDGSPSFSSGTSFNLTDPLLLPLADNGGPTRTMALDSESPAIDVGGQQGAPAVDQRGYARAQAGRTDIGAYEFGAGMNSLVLQISKVPAGIRLSFEALNHVMYRLQRSNDLKEWQDTETIGPLDNTTSVSRELSSDANRQQFFRLYAVAP